MHFAPSADGVSSMQYSAMMILLNRHNAGFGNPEKMHIPEAVRSRQECLQHAIRIARMLREYKNQHGDANTLLGSALYNITMAATTFVAEITDTRKEGSCDELVWLIECLRTMKEMEHTEIVARNVFNIVQATMRVCNVRVEDLDLGSFSPSGYSPPPRLEPPPPPPDPATIGLHQTTLAMWPAFDLDSLGMDEAFPFAFGQPMLDTEPASVLPSMGQYL